MKYNGDTCFSHEQKAVHDAFTNATKFKSASFKSITATLTAAQKNQAVQLLMELEVQDHIGRKVDWNTNDFDLADSIRLMAEHFISAITSLNDTVEQFEILFPRVANLKQVLQGYAGKVTESNYIEKVEYLLNNGDDFNGAIQAILKAQKFIKKNFPKVKEFKRFIEDVRNELTKSDRTDSNIEEAHEEFDRLFKQDMVKNFGNLQQQVQIVKDAYYKLVKAAASGMSHEYQLLSGKIDAAIRDLKDNYPAKSNALNLQKLETLKSYASKRVKVDLSLEYNITCSNCGYSLSDILNYTTQAPLKDSELLIIQSSFIAQEAEPAPSPVPAPGEATPTTESVPAPTPNKPRKITLNIVKRVMTVQEYKTLLNQSANGTGSSQAR